VKPYLSDSDFTLFNSDAREALRELPDESVHMCVTSPPFFGLRDYGTGTWEGGDAGCDHTKPSRSADLKERAKERGYNSGSNFANYGDAWASSDAYRETCGKCGARRIDRQIGLESTPEEWVAQLVSVFEEVKRVLRKDGTLWVECGDSYAANIRSGMGILDNEGYAPNGWSGKRATQTHGSHPYKQKDLIGQPFLLAFALREAGWYWRNVCIWHKPNCMPESVRDRFTVTHSYVMLFSKSARYYFDAEAVRENHTPDGRKTTTVQQGDNSIQHRDGERWPNSGRNARSVWMIATEPLPFEHYAAFPQALAERCIKAGTSERGCCPECGAPWVRETSSELAPTNGRTPPPNKGELRGMTMAGNRTADGWVPNREKTVTTLGWLPSCDCRRAHQTPAGNWWQKPPDPIPCTVLDPFLGSGTTALVARRLGRRSIGIELSPEYCRLTAERTKQLSLLSDEATVA
jgi:DNA modification methylase